MKKTLILLMLLPFIGFTQNQLVRWTGFVQVDQYNVAQSTSPTLQNGTSNMSAGNISGNDIGFSNEWAGFQGRNWPTGTTRNDTKYFETTLTPATGYKIALSQLNFEIYSEGPKSYEVRYSKSPSFSTSTSVISGSNLQLNNNVAVSAPLSGLTINSGETLYVRIYAYQDLSGWGAPFRLKHIGNYLTTAGPNFVGTVSPDAVVTANNDTTTAAAGFPKNINVTANDTYTGTFINTVTIQSQPQYGSVAVEPNKTITFTPAAGFTGTTTFQYKLTGGNGSTSIATVTVNVTAMVASIARNDNASTLKNNAKTINVLANDTAGTGAINNLVVSAAPAHGTAVVNQDRTITYTPANNYTGVDTFTYTITDEYNNTATATVTVGIFHPAVTGPLSGTYAISASVQYEYPQFTTITAAVNHLNANGVSGPVTFLLKDAAYNNTTGEVFPITITQFTGTSAINTVTFKPYADVNTTILGSYVTGQNGMPAVFKLDGADNIIFNGSNSTLTTRNLTKWQHT
jgi:hypothetical protein